MLGLENVKELEQTLDIVKDADICRTPSKTQKHYDFVYGIALKLLNEAKELYALLEQMKNRRRAKYLQHKHTYTFEYALYRFANADEEEESKEWLEVIYQRVKSQYRAN